MRNRNHLPIRTALAVLVAVAAAGAGLQAEEGKVSSASKPASAEALQLTANPDVCVIGFSKDFGSMRLFDGLRNQISCSVPGVTSCRTLSIDDASIGGFFSTDGALCNNGEPCDEAPDLDGRLVGTVDLNARLQNPCPVRGNWEGRFRLLDIQTQMILLASGEIMATLGVGTHRDPTTRDCENCYEAQFNPNFGGFWEIDTEGFIRGTVHHGRHAGCQMRVSFQGQFTVSGDASGPFPFSNWGMEAKADGVLLCPCQ